MKKYLNMMAIILLVFNLMVYISFFNGIDIVPDEAVFPLIIGSSVIGVVFSWLGSKGEQETSVFMVTPLFFYL
ncbi:hypothetical protein ERJ70_17415 [Sediminibacillus dalangtanensis]|uniref:Uncharacterized protein n=1 Tax=Sediminibacillus dalangtanensis TaxID=2729421 RepID=A0ABX7VWJ8_9BACI|nr:hypothetical protein [Sediminibacillus dalangtanensis]QTN00909.1 hypothetical protein ERJ70_17415 [Sediminibacillus dalangtanensis]